jgi:hypothetical protein
MLYVGELNENLKYFTEHKRDTMTSFFYLVSIAYHTSVPALQKCMDTPTKKVFWLRAQPLMHRLLHLLSDLKDLPPITSLRSPKTWKSLGARSGEYGRCGRHSKDRSWIAATVQWAVWGRAMSCCNKTPLLKSPHRLDLLQDADDSLGDLRMLHCLQCSPWVWSAPRLPLVHPKRESA